MRTTICTLVLAIAGLAGCNSWLVVTAQGAGLPCQDDGDCPEGGSCVDQVCQSAATSDGGSGDASGTKSCHAVLTCYTTCRERDECSGCENGLCAADRDTLDTFKECCLPLCGGSFIGSGCYSSCITGCGAELSACNNANCG